jgi:hypothetical protein
MAAFVGQRWCWHRPDASRIEAATSTCLRKHQRRPSSKITLGPYQNTLRGRLAVTRTTTQTPPPPLPSSLVSASWAGTYIAHTLGAAPAATTVIGAPATCASALRTRVDRTARIRHTASGTHQSANITWTNTASKLWMRAHHALRLPHAATSELRLPLESTEKMSWS